MRLTSSTALTAALLVLALSGCAGNQAAENALKPDSRLTTTSRPAEAQPTPSPEPKSSPDIAAKPSPIVNPSPTDWQDRDKIPTQIKPYVEDVLAMNLLKPDAQAAERKLADGELSDSKSIDRKPSDLDKLNAPITRREFAKWLLLINNRFYQSRPTKQVRMVPTETSASSPVFGDIPASDPDFIVLQSLAEAGILPSRLSGEDKNEKFRPTDLLTREDLLRWKAPLDIRSTTQSPTPIDSLQKNLPFQDSNKILHPDSLRAVALDLQNGDQSNLRRSFGYTKLLQPQRSVTRAEAAAALWSIGSMPEVFTAKEAVTGKAPEPSPTPSSKPSSKPSPSPIGG